MPRAIYPGSFDPVHNGHVDIATRASAVFDEIVVAIYDRPPSKTLMFGTEERVQLFSEATENITNIRVTPFTGLAPDFARASDADFILRGLRAGFDFELEFEMALMNRKLAPDIEIVSFMSSLEYQYLSSTLLKDIARLGGDIREFVPDHVASALKHRMKGPAKAPK